LENKSLLSYLSDSSKKNIPTKSVERGVGLYTLQTDCLPRFLLFGLKKFVVSGNPTDPKFKLPTPKVSWQALAAVAREIFTSHGLVEAKFTENPLRMQ
jgi:hypothetical protein